MMIIIAAQHQENIKSLLGEQPASEHEFIWVQAIDDFKNFENADGFIDLDGSQSDYSNIQRPLLVNQTVKCFSDIKTGNNGVARFCGWPGFVERDSWEIATPTNELPGELIQLFKAINKDYTIVADTPGFIAPRILSTIINEACYAIHEGISDAAQIDVAMKLGTNYPEGPIAWGRKIGAPQIVDLLQALSIKDSRYQPHLSIQKILA